MMKATDMIRCETYRCTMTAGACIVRQVNAEKGGQWHYGPSNKMKPGALDHNCRNCAQGREIAGKVPAAQVADYRSGLAAVRKAARVATYGPKSEKETIMTNDIQAPAAESPAPTKVCNCKECGHGGKPQPLSSFDNNSKRPDGKSDRCKDCRRRIHREGYAKKRLSMKNTAGDAGGRKKTRRGRPSSRQHQAKTTESPYKFEQLAALLSGRRRYDRAQLEQIRDLCGAVFNEIDAYLQMHAMFNGRGE